ncbi:hypothetical protein BX667DRAFT_499127 [Coemansia mojavensis]|nr:hypothetical protein BX667DRAFT_499127 [Coemansia mojavensis]
MRNSNLMLTAEPSSSNYWDSVRVRSRTMSNTYTLYNYSETGIIVDKTLVCKAFFDIEHAVIRLCAPEGSGKTHNTKLIHDFFNVLTKHDMLASAPALHFIDSLSKEFDPVAARTGRMKLFNDTLLLDEHPEFFEKHFHRYPVIYLNFELGDIETLSGFYIRLALAISHATDRFVAGIDCDAMPELQRAKLQTLFSKHKKSKDDLSLESDEWYRCPDGAEIRFLRLKDILDTAYKSSHIILIDRYDDAFESLQGKPWIKEAHGVLMRLLNTMLVDNKQLIKGLLIGVHQFSLEHPDSPSLASIPTISLTTRYWLKQTGVQSSLLSAFAAMFGYTSSEIVSLCSEYSKSNTFTAVSFEDVSDIIIKQWIGYDFGFKDKRGLPACFDKCIYAVRYSKSKQKQICIELAKLMQSVESCQHYYQLLLDENWSALLLFISRLVYNYSTGNSGCTIGNDNFPGMIEFVLEESYCLYNNKPVCLNFFTTWLVQNAYLTISPDNTLSIPNNYTRGMWENILLSTVHGTRLQLNQDTERQRLIDSLYRGETFVLSDSLDFMWEQLADSTCALPAAKLIETTCAFIAGRLTAPKQYLNGKSNISFDYTDLINLNPKKTNWNVRIAPYGRYLQDLMVSFNFVYIDADDTVDVHNALEQAAEAALNVVQDIYGVDLKLYIGIAIGQSGFAIKTLDKNNPA